MSNSTELSKETKKLKKIQRYIRSSYNLTELEHFCVFYLGLEHDTFPPNDNMVTRSQNLVEYFHRRRMIHELQKGLYEDRPEQYLNQFPKDEELGTGVAQAIESPEKLAPSISESLTLLSPELVTIIDGDFWMGNDENVIHSNLNETPRHIAKTDAYEISKYPITNEQYAAFVQSINYQPPSHWKNGQLPQNQLDHPVTHVNYTDALTYCAWLSQETGKIYRLPTEQEWEKAARGKGGQTIYPWGNVWQPTYCNSIETNLGETAPVGRYEKHNRSLSGVVDMVGNVWEWTSSWYQAYPGNTYPARHYGYSHRVVRGGSWYNKKPQIACRIAGRGRYKPEIKRAYLGFRIVAIN